MGEQTENLNEFADTFLSLARSQATGTLRVRAADGQAKAFVFLQGLIAEIDTGRPDTLLEAALLKTGAFSDRDVKRARKAQAKGDKTLGAALLELGSAPEQRIQECLQEEIHSEVCEVLRWPPAAIEFFEHAEDERLEDFSCELGEFYEVYTDPEEVFLEAAHLLGDWDIVARHFRLLDDVVYATPASLRYIQDAATHPYENAIVSAVDGTKSVGEVIEDICGKGSLERFVALMAVSNLARGGELERINPVQMYQLGVECAEKNQLEKACRLLRRANERGLDDFDLQLKLAQMLETLGKRGEACERYFQFANKCADQGRSEEALRSLQRVLGVDKEHLAAREKIVELLLRLHRHEEARDEALILAGKLASASDPRAGLAILVKARDANPGDNKLQQKIVELSEASGDEARAREERAVLAKQSAERQDNEAALEGYQKIFCEGQDTLEVRLQLVKLHQERGNRQKALDHITAILNYSDKRRVRDERQLLKLHETVCELKPSDIRSNRWLVDSCIRGGNKEKAVEILRRWIGHLETEGESLEAVHAYEKLISLDGRNEHRWGLVAFLDKIGRQKDSQRELRSIANLSLRKKEFDEAVKALDALLRSAPLDVEGRKLQVELFEGTGAADRRARTLREMVLLALLAGNLDEARQFCRRLEGNSSPDAEVAFRLAECCAERGDRAHAIEHFLAAARGFHAGQDLGSTRRALASLLAIEPKHAEGLALLADLEPKRAAPAAPVPEATRAEARVLRAAEPAAAAPASVAPAPVAPAAVAAAAPEPPAPRAAATAPPEPAPASRAAVPEVAPRAAEAGAPSTVKATVQSITARLRQLKSGADAPQGGRVVAARVKGISAKLRSLKEGNASPPAAAPEPAPATLDAQPAVPATPASGGGGEEAAPRTSAELASVASRLRALAAKTGEKPGSQRRVKADVALEPPGESPAASPQDGTSAAGAPRTAAELASVASRLRALTAKKGEKAAAGDPPPAEAEAADPPPARAPANELETGQVEKLGEALGEKAESGTARKKLALGGSASKLAALRKKAQAGT